MLATFHASSTRALVSESARVIMAMSLSPGFAVTELLQVWRLAGLPGVYRVVTTSRLRVAPWFTVAAVTSTSSPS